MQTNFGQFLRRRAFLSPGVEAIVEPAMGRRLNFRQLNARCNRVAHALSASGVKPGDRVALLLMNGAEFVESFFAVAKIGAVNVPLNWRLVADELEFILKDSGSTVLLYSENFAPVVAELQRRGDKTDLRCWVQVDGKPPAFALDYGAWCEAMTSEEPDPAGFDDDLLFIMYTSGTTGLPKGVMHSHRTVMWSVMSVGASADMHYKDRYLTALPLFHVGALTPTMGCIHRGCTQVILKAFDPKVAWELIRDEKINTTLLVPAMLQFMQAAYDSTVHDASTLRWCLSGAAPVPVSLIQAYAEIGVEIHQVYGLTESGGPGCLILGEDAITRAGSAGRAYFFTDVRVVEVDGSDCAPGEPGEVLIRGPHNMLGYWNRPGRHRRRAARRLAAHRGHRHDGRGRLRHHPRSHEGHADLGRREHLSGRDRKHADVPPAAGRCGGDRPGVAQVGRGAAGGGGAEEGRPTHRSRSAGLVQGSAGRFQAAEGGDLQRRDSTQPQRQDTQARAARAIQVAGARA